jgi:hypothetical protein
MERFKDVQMTAVDDNHSGRPSTATYVEVKEQIDKCTRDN